MMVSGWTGASGRAHAVARILARIPRAISDRRDISQPPLHKAIAEREQPDRKNGTCVLYTADGSPDCVVSGVRAVRRSARRCLRHVLVRARLELAAGAPIHAV